MAARRTLEHRAPLDPTALTYRHVLGVALRNICANLGFR